jgi:putative N-acetyltransferase (TIGR04045 family)
MFDLVIPFESPVISAELASEPWQLAGYRALRRRVFCEEQKLFEHDDSDEHDGVAVPIVALSSIAGMPDRVVGVVRIYESSPGVWYGGRLAVDPAYRRHRLVGEGLIHKAVESAHGWGCRRFFATVQVLNVPYFERHHFHGIEPTRVCGVAHELMEADLERYPPDRANPALPPRSWMQQCA